MGFKQLVLLPGRLAQVSLFLFPSHSLRPLFYHCYPPSNLGCGVRSDTPHHGCCETTPLTSIEDDDRTGHELRLAKLESVRLESNVPVTRDIEPFCQDHELSQNRYQFFNQTEQTGQTSLVGSLYSTAKLLEQPEQPGTASEGPSSDVPR